MNFQELETITIPKDKSAIHLQKIVQQMIKSWPVFQLAFQYNTTDFTQSHREQEMIDKFTQQICAFVISFNVKEEDLEELLVQQVDFYFQMSIDDDSEKLLAKQIFAVFNDLEKGSTKVYDDLVIMIRQFNETKKVQHQFQNQCSDSSSSSSNEEEQQQQKQQIEEQKPVQLQNDDDWDDDGFQTVTYKKKFGKNK